MGVVEAACTSALNAFRGMAAGISGEHRASLVGRAERGGKIQYD
jgi:hypothetical protein